MTTSIPFPKSAIAFAMLLTIFGFGSVRAQGNLTVGNTFVQAAVNQSDGWGLLSIFYFDQSGARQRLTFADYSYLTVEVNGTFFSNNPNLSAGEDWETGTTVPVQFLNNGSSSRRGDTIETVWPFRPDGFELIQDVFPVASSLSGSGQIVYRFSVRNDTSISLPAQAQFILDLATSSSAGANDDPKITTREGYNENAGVDFWHNFKTLPPYFVTSEYDICTKTFPGQVGVGYTVDDYAPVAMGLIKPSLMANVNLPQYVALGSPPSVFGFPNALEGTAMSPDNALLLQWPQQVIPRNATVELGCGSYGTAPCGVCVGSLDAMTLHPEHIVWNGKNYVPDHFPVDAIVWNSNAAASAISTIGTQTVSNAVSGLQGPVRIVAPVPVSGNGNVQTHALQSGGSSSPDSTVQECGASFMTWEDTLLQNIFVNCATDSIYDIGFSVAARGIDSTNVLGGACSCPILVDCQGERDSVPGIPTITVLSRSGSFDGSICNARAIEAAATDPRMCALCFVDSVKAIQLRNMTLAVEDSSVWKFRVSVVDSMLDGSATIVAFDKTGISDTATFTYCTIPDTRAPRVVVTSDDSCSCQRLNVYDNRAWDRGLDTIIITGMAGVRINATVPASNPNFLVNGLPQAMLSVITTPGPGLHWICISAVDRAGNKFDTCVSFGSASVSRVVSSGLDLEVAPNPASTLARISLAGAPSAHVEIYDVLGREVASFQVNGSYEWRTGAVPAGTYIVRAVADGVVVSQRLEKQ